MSPFSLSNFFQISISNFVRLLGSVAFGLSLTLTAHGDPNYPVSPTSSLLIGEQGCHFKLSGESYGVIWTCPSEQDLPVESASTYYLRLAQGGYFQNQTSQWLKRSGFVVANGGLCGPTSVSMIFDSLYAQAFFTTDKENAITFLAHDSSIGVATILLDYEKAFAEDPRLGTDPDKLASVVPRTYPIVKTSRINIEAGEMTPMTLQNAFSGGHAIAQISVQFLTPNGQVHDGHSLVMLGIKPEQHLVMISDPNFPEFVHYREYTEVDFNGVPSISFELVPVYGKDSHRVVIFGAVFYSIKPGSKPFKN